MLIADSTIFHKDYPYEVAIHAHRAPLANMHHVCTSACNTNGCRISEPSRSGCHSIKGLSQDDYYSNGYYTVCTVGTVTSVSNLAMIRMRADFTGIIVESRHINTLGYFGHGSPGKVVRNGMLLSGSGAYWLKLFAVDWTGLVKSSWSMNILNNHVNEFVFAPYGHNENEANILLNYRCLNDRSGETFPSGTPSGTDNYFTEIYSSVPNSYFINPEYSQGMPPISSILQPGFVDWTYAHLDITTINEQAAYYGCGDIGSPGEIVANAVHIMPNFTFTWPAITGCSEYKVYTSGYTSGMIIRPNDIYYSEYPDLDPYLDIVLLSGKYNYQAIRVSAIQNLSFVPGLEAGKAHQDLSEMIDFIDTARATVSRNQMDIVHSLSFSGTITRYLQSPQRVGHNIGFSQSTSISTTQRLIDSISFVQSVIGTNLFQRLSNGFGINDVVAAVNMRQHVAQTLTLSQDVSKTGTVNCEVESNLELFGYEVSIKSGQREVDVIQDLAISQVMSSVFDVQRITQAIAFHGKTFKVSTPVYGNAVSLITFTPAVNTTEFGVTVSNSCSFTHTAGSNESEVNRTVTQTLTLTQKRVGIKSYR